MSAVLGRYGAPKRTRKLATLPDDVLHLIFAKLEFRDKISCGLVCNQWDKLLKAGSAAGRHWVVDYDVERLVSTSALMQAIGEPAGESGVAAIERWFVNRAGAVESVQVFGEWELGQEGAAARDLLQRQLPFLAGCLSRHGCTLELTLFNGWLFRTPPLSSSSFLTLLAPMVKSLKLDQLMDAISPDEFAAICQLSGLETLHIEACGRYGEGLQELTSDVGKLTNLKTLRLPSSLAIDYIPESISCLQKLEHFVLSSVVSELPPGLGKLQNLITLSVRTLVTSLHSVPDLEGLKSLTEIKLVNCSLKGIPTEFSGLSSLTSLCLSSNLGFDEGEGWPWWPPTLSRLTQLKELNLRNNEITSLPPHISALRQLKKLDVSCNRLRGLPAKLSSLVNLEVILLRANWLGRVPVTVLSGLTALKAIDLRNNGRRPSTCAPRGDPVFKVESCLLPILHPGLVMLDLQQYRMTQWDPVSLFHLGCAVVELRDRRPRPSLLYIFQW